MSEASLEERTEDATPRRREDARDEGRIPKSPELNAAILLLATAVMVKAVGPGIGTHLMDTMGSSLVIVGSVPLDGEIAVSLVRGVGWKLLAALAVLMGATMATTLAIGGIQARGVLTMKPLAPDFKRINPSAQIKRMFGMQPWVELLKSLLKLTIVGVAVWGSMRAAWPETIALAQQTPRELVAVVRDYAVKMLLTAGFAFLGLALADYLYQIWEHEKSLRMTKEEVKQEHKSNEGDPLIKAQRRAMGRAMARRQMFQEVPNADVVITNPTHIAVAIKYDPERAEAPLVLAIGQRKIAERIKQIARESGVPMVENKPLARALLASARVGSTIPVELYMAVAEVLAWVMTQRSGTRRKEWN